MAKSLLKRGQGGCGSRKQGLGAEPGKCGTGNIIALSYCGASLPRLALPLRKFLQTKIYTDTPWAQYRCPPCCFLFLILLLLFSSFAFYSEIAKPCRVNGRRCPPPTLIFLVSIKIWRSLRISSLKTKIYHEPLDLWRKSTSIMTDTMRLHVDACLLWNKEATLVIFAS